MMFSGQYAMRTGNCRIALDEYVAAISPFDWSSGAQQAGGLAGTQNLGFA